MEPRDYLVSTQSRQCFDNFEEVFNERYVTLFDDSLNFEEQDEATFKEEDDEFNISPHIHAVNIVHSLPLSHMNIATSLKEVVDNQTQYKTCKSAPIMLISPSTCCSDLKATPRR